MPPRFNRLVLFAVLPLTTWACQCATPVSIDDNQEGAAGPLPEASTTTEETPPTSTGGDLRGSLLSTGSQVKCLDSDGDGYGVGPDCLDVDCDDGDSNLGADGARSCFTGPAGAAGQGLCQAGTQTCAGGVLSPCVGEVLPQTESCDGVDNDCDGEIDEALTRSCYDGPAGTSGVGSCTSGVQSCVDGQFGACEGQTTPAAELCDGADNDCDGDTDEAVTRSCYDGPSGTSGVGSCAPGVQTCVAGQFGACEGQTTPATELCDGADNDCDGETDEALTRSCYDGPSGTLAVGSCTPGVQTCVAGQFGACEGETTPAAELCDGADNDCDGNTDEAISRSCYDGPSGTSGVGRCAPGVQTCVAGQFGACQGEITPVTEQCDGADNDCDGNTDEAVTRACYDGPSGTAGVGICASGIQLCQNGQFSACQGATVPAFESCDGADDDCDGDTDENVERFTRDRSQQSQNVVLRPVDIILVVDNSQSMTDEIVAVQNNINVNFANLLAGSGIDYRVILLSKHGSATGSQSICIKSPLSGNGSCSSISTCPVNSSRFFHYSTEIGSHDSLERIVTTYNTPDTCGLAPNGWSAWLRPGAARVFIEITDDSPSTCSESSCSGADYWTADKFETRLFALSPSAFGSAASRGYLFHTIAGLHENVPATAAWTASQPLVTSTCTGNGGDVVNAGLAYQRLSTRTGGLRYPICQYQSFDAVFREVATGIIDRTVMACDFTVAQIPQGFSMDGVGLELSPGSGSTATLTRVADAAACTNTGFYVSGTAITLCPGACALWQNDTQSSLEVTFSCSP